MREKEHLIIIIDNNKVIAPKIYSCFENEKTKEEAIKSAKKLYEINHNNFSYIDYYFLH